MLLLGMSPAAGQAPAAEQSQPSLPDETLAGLTTATLQPEGEPLALPSSSSPGSIAATAQPAVPPALLAPAPEPSFLHADAAPAGSGAGPPAADSATLTETEVFPSLLQAAAPGDEALAVSGEQLAAQAQDLQAFPAEELLGQGAAAEPVEAGVAGGQPALPERSNFCEWECRSWHACAQASLTHTCLPPPAASLISLLSPPPDFVPPELTEQQRYNLPRLQQLRQATGTVSVRRCVECLVFGLALPSAKHQARA